MLCTKAIKVFDHDYEYLSEGKVIPHGIYDLQAKKGYIGGFSETADSTNIICFGGGRNIGFINTLTLKIF